jgi:hypothetical protein
MIEKLKELRRSFTYASGDENIVDLYIMSLGVSLHDFSVFL